jgi:hypothetical protein
MLMRSLRVKNDIVSVTTPAVMCPPYDVWYEPEVPLLPLKRKILREKRKCKRFPRGKTASRLYPGAVMQINDLRENGTAGFPELFFREKGRFPVSGY